MCGARPDRARLTMSRRLCSQSVETFVDTTALQDSSPKSREKSHFTINRSKTCLRRWTKFSRCLSKSCLGKWNKKETAGTGARQPSSPPSDLNSGHGGFVVEQRSGAVIGLFDDENVVGMRSRLRRNLTLHRYHKSLRNSIYRDRPDLSPPTRSA